MREYIIDSVSSTITNTRRLFRKVKRMWAYAKQGAISEDWDYSYFLQDIKFKLNRMGKETLLYSHILHHEEIERINTIIKNLNHHIDKELEDNFYDEADNMHLGFDCPEPDYPGDSVVVTSKYKEGFNKDTYKKAIKKGDKEKKKNLKSLFKLLETELYKLWI